MDLKEKTLREIIGLLKVKDWLIVGSVCVGLVTIGHYFGALTERSGKNPVREELLRVQGELATTKSEVVSLERERSEQARLLQSEKSLRSSDKDELLASVRAYSTQIERLKLEAHENAENLKRIDDLKRQLKSAKTDLSALVKTLEGTRSELKSERALVQRAVEMTSSKLSGGGPALTEATDESLGVAQPLKQLKQLTDEIAPLIAGLKDGGSSKTELAVGAFVEGVFSLPEGSVKDVTEENLLIGVGRGNGNCLALSANGNKTCIETGDRYDLKWPHAPFYLDEMFAGKERCFLDILEMTDVSGNGEAKLRLKCT